MLRVSKRASPSSGIFKFRELREHTAWWRGGLLAFASDALCGSDAPRKRVKGCDVGNLLHVSFGCCGLCDTVKYSAEMLGNGAGVTYLEVYLALYRARSRMRRAILW